MAELGRVILIGHSYLAQENRKQLKALADHVKLTVLSPCKWHEGMSHFDFRPNLVEEKGWCMYLLKERRFPWLPQSQYILPGLTEIVGSTHPLLIHIESDPWTTIAVQAIAVRNRVRPATPIVCTAKQNTFTQRGWPFDLLKRKVGQWGVANVARFIGVSASVSEIYLERFKVSAKYFDFNTHLGVDTDLFRPANEKERFELRSRWVGKTDPSSLFLVGYCGRLEKHKGILDLIEAVRRVRDNVRVDLKLLILGDGPMWSLLEQKVQTEAFLHLFPHVPHAQVPAFMKCLDLFVMPARKSKHHEEHDAHAVLEALACGLTCIGTDSGVIPDILGGCGVVVPASNVGALADAIALHASTPSSCLGKTHEVNALGRRQIEAKFSLEAVAQNNFRTYLRAIEDWKK